MKNEYNPLDTFRHLLLPRNERVVNWCGIARISERLNRFDAVQGPALGCLSESGELLNSHSSCVWHIKQNICVTRVHVPSLKAWLQGTGAPEHLRLACVALDALLKTPCVLVRVSVRTMGLLLIARGPLAVGGTGLMRADL
jgi:hypothetical protein